MRLLHQFYYTLLAFFIFGFILPENIGNFSVIIFKNMGCGGKMDDGKEIPSSNVSRVDVE